MIKIEAASRLAEVSAKGVYNSGPRMRTASVQDYADKDEKKALKFHLNSASKATDDSDKHYMEWYNLKVKYGRQHQKTKEALVNHKAADKLADQHWKAKDKLANKIEKRVGKQHFQKGHTVSFHRTGSANSYVTHHKGTVVGHSPYGGVMVKEDEDGDVANVSPFKLKHTGIGSKERNSKLKLPWKA